MRLYFLALGTLLIVCVGCASDGQQVLHKNEYHAPPADMLAHPGPMVGGPGPGVMLASAEMAGPSGMAGMMGPAGPMCPPGGMAGYPAYANMPPALIRTSQIRFLGPDGMSIGWKIGAGFADKQLMAPARYNFTQCATYRLKLSNIPGRDGLVLYPSLHVYPTQAATAAYIEHSTLPLRITEEDLDQVETTNLVTKVIYLPDARFQELAIAGVEELVSTRLGPGQDPVAQADRQGTILAVLRIGNMDLEMNGPSADVQKTSHVAQINGEEGHLVAPVPEGPHTLGIGAGGVPADMMVGGPAGPGMSPYDPIVGMSGVPMYGYPSTSTPIGLPGPPHIPYGRPAGLKSHTLRNTTNYNIPGPVDHVLIDVKHEPGLSLPDPVKHIEYTEKHPDYQQGEVSQPAWAQ